MTSSTATEKTQSPNAVNWAHDLWKTRDNGKPAQILDRNGEVVLDLCKRCGKAEGDLTADNCKPAKHNPLLGPTNLAY